MAAEITVTVSPAWDSATGSSPHGCGEGG